MKIYTKTGDKGTTSLVGGTRVAKNSARLNAYGTVDELNSLLGVVLAAGAELDEADRSALLRIQSLLFDLGCQLATESDSKWQPRAITDDDVRFVESEIDRLQATLPPHFQFILPGGTLAAAQTHVARTVARRAERLMLTLNDELSAAGSPLAAQPLQFVNRLSDYLFVLARAINNRAGMAENTWQQN